MSLRIVSELFKHVPVHLKGCVSFGYGGNSIASAGKLYQHCLLSIRPEQVKSCWTCHEKLL